MRTLIPQQTEELARHLYQTREDIQSSVARTEYIPDIRKELKIAAIPKYRGLATKIVVQIANMDTLSATEMLLKEGKQSGILYNPLILNLANERIPGGGWKWSAHGQEESLMLKSTYCLNLCPYDVNAARGWKYPLGPYGAVYAPDVVIHPGSPTASYHVSILAMPAVCNPVWKQTERTDEGKQSYLPEYAKEEELLRMREKIESIFTIAITRGHDSLILGALGCGVYHNPPSIVADIFREFTIKYQQYFRRIIYAILSDGTTIGDNYKIFLSTFTK